MPKKEMITRLESLCNHIGKKWGVALMEFGGEEDHIDLLLDLHPHLTPSRFINHLKRVTSRLLRKDFLEHLQKFYYKPVLWRRAYCLISAGGAPFSVLKSYIERQGEH